MRKALTILILAFAVRAAAQDLDLAPAKGAVNRLKAMPKAVQEVQTVIAQTNFGPFEIHDSCCARRFIFCIQTWNWWYKFPNYVWLKDNLQARYEGIRQTAGQLDARFAPVKQWMTGTVPALAVQFDNTSRRLNDLQLRMANAPAPVKAFWEKESVGYLDQLQSSLQRSTEQLRGGIGGISDMNASMTRQLTSVQQLRAGIDNMLATDERNLNNTVGGWPCGDGDARNFYYGVRDQVRNQYNAVTDAAQRYGVTAAQTDQSTSLLLGTLLNFQTRQQGVLDKLHAAQISPAGAIQQLRLHVAAAAFADLAAYARQQFP